MARPEEGCKVRSDQERWSVGSLSSQWLVAADPAKITSWTSLFSAATPLDGKLTGSQAKPIMMESRLPTSVLSKVWALADVDRDGMLDQSEFCLAMYLMDLKIAGHDLPGVLPQYLLPPGETASSQIKEETSDVV